MFNIKWIGPLVDEALYRAKKGGRNQIRENIKVAAEGNRWVP